MPFESFYEFFSLVCKFFNSLRLFEVRQSFLNVQQHQFGFLEFSKVDKKISEITQQHICDRCILSNQFAIFFFYDHLNSRPDCQPLVPEMMSLPKFSSNIAKLH